MFSTADMKIEPSSSSQLTFPNDRIDGSRLLNEYSNSMPTFNGSQYHFEYTLEAQEPQTGVPFSESIIGRLPTEIREQIYVYVVTIEPLPEHLRYYYHYRICQPLPDAYNTDHFATSKRAGQRRWPQDFNKPCSASALTATFPPRSKPQARSRIAFLLTCRQIYIEAWRLYYSVNRFYFTSDTTYYIDHVKQCYDTIITDCTHLLDRTPPVRRRAFRSLRMTLCLSGAERILRHLSDCDDLQDLTLLIVFKDYCDYHSQRVRADPQNIYTEPDFSPLWEPGGRVWEYLSKCENFPGLTVWLQFHGDSRVGLIRNLRGLKKIKIDLDYLRSPVFQKVCEKACEEVRLLEESRSRLNGTGNALQENNTTS
ncbi:hypothetical protein ACLMJK_007816 [Lecanora helva]